METEEENYLKKTEGSKKKVQWSWPVFSNKEPPKYRRE
jgi:hypothetical protein